MKCGEVQKIVNDSDATRAYRTEVREHLQSCRECRQEESDLSKLRTLLLEPDRVSVPWDFNERLSERIAAGREQRRWWRFASLPAFAYAASLVLIASIALGLWINRAQPPIPADDTPATATTAGGETEARTATDTDVTGQPNPREDPKVLSAGTRNGFVTTATPKPTSGNRRVRQEESLAATASGSYTILVRDPARGERILTVDPVVFGSVPVLGSAAPQAQAVRYEGTIF